ncbi:MAG: hypothetical protein JW958_00510 [Candidatus Eisenbacteria bacterium]|nr:hypothetical protein [Candidatus Eisenbacteria bacterium]
MMKLMGLWVDLRRAYMIEIGPDGNPAVKCIEADPDDEGAREHSRARESRIVRRKGPGGRDLRRAFYQQILAAVSGADRIVLFGPDDAKHELDLEIRKRPHLLERMVDVLQLDKFEEADFAARLRAYYRLETKQNPPSRRVPAA